MYNFFENMLSKNCPLEDNKMYIPSKYYANRMKTAGGDSFSPICQYCWNLAILQIGRDHTK